MAWLAVAVCLCLFSAPAVAEEMQPACSSTDESCADNVGMLQVAHRSSVAAETGTDVEAARQERLREHDRTSTGSTSRGQAHKNITVPDALLAEQRGSLDPPSLTVEDFNEIKKKVEDGWNWLYGQQEVRAAMKKVLHAPGLSSKENACHEEEAYLNEVGSSVGAIATVGGSLGVGYGYNGEKSGDKKGIESGAYYTICGGLSKGAGIEGVGISSSTMHRYGNIAGLSMVYEGSICIGVCAGYSHIYCLPDPPEKGHDKCGEAKMTGVGAKIGIGWETCYTKKVPDELYQASKEFISCGRRRRSWSEWAGGWR